MNESDFLPYRDLAVCIIKQAVLDLSYKINACDVPPRRRGQLGAVGFTEHERGIRAGAAEWLEGEDCRELCEHLEIDHGAVVRRARGEKT